MRLIDATNLSDRIANIMACWRCSPCLSPSEAEKAARDLGMALTIIGEMPTVDAEIVVRCKDCKHFTNDLEIGGCGKYHYCAYHTSNAEYCDGACYVDEDAYCSYGEKE